MILPGVYVGGVETVINLPNYISRVVNCATELTNLSNRSIGNYLRIDLDDSGSPKDLELFERSIRQVINFIEQGLDQNQNILIHCFMGTSRSCSVATAFVLSQKPELTVQEAVDFVISKRPMAFDGGERQVYREVLDEYFP